MPRTRPYTARGIKRLKCVRCGCRARATWQICSDNHIYRPVCLTCDVALNEHVLRFMGFSDHEIVTKMDTYRARLGIPK